MNDRTRRRPRGSRFYAGSGARPGVRGCPGGTDARDRGDPAAGRGWSDEEGLAARIPPRRSGSASSCRGPGDPRGGGRRGPRRRRGRGPFARANTGSRARSLVNVEVVLADGTILEYPPGSSCRMARSSPSARADRRASGAPISAPVTSPRCATGACTSAIRRKAWSNRLSGRRPPRSRRRRARARAGRRRRRHLPRTGPGPRHLDPRRRSPPERVDREPDLGRDGGSDPVATAGHPAAATAGPGAERPAARHHLDGDRARGSYVLIATRSRSGPARDPVYPGSRVLGEFTEQPPTACRYRVRIASWRSGCSDRPAPQRHAGEVIVTLAAQPPGSAPGGTDRRRRPGRPPAPSPVSPGDASPVPRPRPRLLARASPPPDRLPAYARNLDAPDG